MRVIDQKGQVKRPAEVEQAEAQQVRLSEIERIAGLNGEYEVIDLNKDRRSAALPNTWHS